MCFKHSQDKRTIRQLTQVKCVKKSLHNHSTSGRATKHLVRALRSFFGQSPERKRAGAHRVSDRSKAKKESVTNRKIRLAADSFLQN